MKKFLINQLLPFILSLVLISLIIFYLEPPKSWPEASNLQILLIFIPLMFVSITLINLLLNNLTKSSILGLGLVCLAVLQAGRQLNIPTTIIVITTTFLILYSFKKWGQSGFKKLPKIPKLHRFERKR